MHLHKSSLWPVFAGHGKDENPIFRRCKITSEDYGIMCVYGTGEILFEDIILEYTGTEINKNYFPFIRMPGVTVRNLHVIYPEQYWKTDNNRGYIGILEQGTFENITLNGDADLAKKKFSGI